jgi:uncharacterized protein (TIGR00369 family)
VSEHFHKLERMYAAAPCNQGLPGLSLVVAEGRSEAGMDVELSQFHAANSVHGSYYFKLLDDAAFFAANSMVEDVLVLTASFNVDLLCPVSTGRIIAAGWVLRPGAQMIFASAVLRDEAGRELAHGSGVFARSRIALAGLATYR